MLTGKELKVLELFRKNIFSDFTIREIMKKIKTGSYSWTFNLIKKLQSENMIILTRKGNSQLCKINLDEQKTITYLSLLEELNALNQKLPNTDKLFELMPLDFHIFLVAGSYADGTYSRNSDMDIVLIIDRKEEKKWLLNKLLNKGELMIPKLHPYVFTKEEFLEMLTNKEFNYGKEIEKKHLILSGAESYFRLIRQAIQNGYKH